MWTAAAVLTGSVLDLQIRTSLITKYLILGVGNISAAPPLQGMLAILLLPLASSNSSAQQHLTPLAGPAHGGTVVTARVAASCGGSASCLFSLFGSNSTIADGDGRSIPATRVSEGEWACTLPHATEVGAAATADWATILESSSVTGGAVVVNKTVRLTSAGVFDSMGGFVVAPPINDDYLGSASLTVSFDLLIGRGTAGEGFSLSLAHLPSTSVFADENGIAGGLAISFQTGEERLSVVFREQLLHSVRLDGAHFTVSGCPLAASMHEPLFAEERVSS